MFSDIFSIPKGIIVHQVNCKGVMGSGIALEIKKRYPCVYNSYKKFSVDLKPGMIQLVSVNNNIIVCNLAGQENFGTDKQYTDYKAVETGLLKLAKQAQKISMDVYVPFGMGCGLGGGDWVKYRQIIKDILPDAIICCPYFQGLQVWTTCFSNLKMVSGKDSEIIPLSIARYMPKNLQGDIQSLPELFPSKSLLSSYKKGKVDYENYKKIYYNEVLKNLDVKNLIKKIKTFGNKVVLVCYEKPDDFCHRHIVSHWLKYLTGYKIQEFGVKKKP